MKPRHFTAPLLSQAEIGKQAAQQQSKKVLLSAATSLGCNSLYALYLGVLGIIHVSLWFFSLCAFYSILAVMRFFALTCGRKRNERDPISAEYFIWKVCGVLLLLLSFVLACVVSISLARDTATAYDKITMITIATYTFSKIGTLVGKGIRQRPISSPLPLVIRNISYVEAAASVLTLQRSMLVSFGTMEKGQMDRMNALVGAAVCLFVLVLGILMILKGRKEPKKWQNPSL